MVDLYTFNFDDMGSRTTSNGGGQVLVANPRNQYLINSPMLPNLEHDADGGLAPHI
jgi:hypothetical protein